jgi:hypothetical protein
MSDRNRIRQGDNTMLVAARAVAAFVIRAASACACTAQGFADARRSAFGET